jgi:hypothetical protein
MLEVDFQRLKKNILIKINIQGLILGMSQYTTKAHIVRAALEGISYQTREVNICFCYYIFIQFFNRLLMPCMKIVVYVF